MSLEKRFHLALMRRRAGLFARQIAVAAVLTIAALGFLAASVVRQGEPVVVMSLQADIR